MKAILIFVALFATVAAQLSSLCNSGSDLSIEGLFSSQAGVSTQQSISFKNLLSGEGFTNSLRNVTFTVEGLGVRVSYAHPPFVQVGTILSGVTGWGNFYSQAEEGSYAVFVTAAYQVDGKDEWKIACKEFSLNVGGYQRRSEEYSFEERSDFELRSNDVLVTPTTYQGEDSTTVWNNYIISTYSNAVTNVTWAATPNDLSVIIGYPSTGNYVASIPANNGYTSSISVYGNEGSYTLNCTVKYRKASTGTTWQYYSIAYPLTITGGSSGSSSVKRVAEIQSFKQREAIAIDASAHGVQLVRADFALGVAVAGIAVVAAVAVVAAMVVVRRRSTGTSSA